MGSLKITFPRAALFVRDAFKVLCIVREGCCVASLGGIQSATAGYNVLFSAVASSSEVTLTCSLLRSLIGGESHGAVCCVCRAQILGWVEDVICWALALLKGACLGGTDGHQESRNGAPLLPRGCILVSLVREATHFGGCGGDHVIWCKSVV